MRITVRSCFAANNSACVQLSHLFRAQTQMRASKPFKCGFLTKKFKDKSVNLLFELCTFWQISWCIRFKAINYWRKRNLLTLYFLCRILKFWTKWKRALCVGINNCETSVLVKCINTLSCWMIKQLLNSISKYRDLSVSRRSIICLCLRHRQIIDLLATDKSRYFSQPRPIIVYYFYRRSYF